MQQWEYLEVLASCLFGWWGDSLGRSGKLTSVQPEGLRLTFRSVGPMLNGLSDEGWEVVAVYETDNSMHRILPKRPK